MDRLSGSRDQPAAAAAGREALEAFEDLAGSFRRRFERQLAIWLEGRGREAIVEVQEAAELTGRLEQYVMRGGKRLRPAILYYAFQGCGGTREESVMPACLAVELLHTYLLIHDDIMDHAETRRGEPSAHRLFAEDHRRRSWSGDADHHGLSVAILLGDLAHTYAEELFDACEVASDLRSRARRVFSDMCREVIVGQYLEMTAAQRPSLSEEELLRVLRMKSGRYSVERPIQLGSILAGASADQLESLSRFGSGMGEAFQLQDDLLGMFGDHEEVGKPVGGDLTEGKFTVLIFHTLAGASEADRRRVRSALGNPDLDAEEVDRVREIIRSSGAEARVSEMIAERLRAARRTLEAVELSEEGRNFFFGLAEYLRQRKE